MEPKARGWPYNVFTSVVRVVDAIFHSLLVLGLHRHRFLSPSLSIYRVKVPKRTNGREFCVEVVHAIVL